MGIISCSVTSVYGRWEMVRAEFVVGVKEKVKGNL